MTNTDHYDDDAIASDLLAFATALQRAVAALAKERALRADGKVRPESVQYLADQLDAKANQAACWAAQRRGHVLDTKPC